MPKKKSPYEGNPWSLPKEVRFRLLQGFCSAFQVEVPGKKNIGIAALNRASAVAEEYGAKLVIKHTHFTSASYDPWTGTIYMGPSEDLEDFIHAFCHELAHHIQRKVYGRGFEWVAFKDNLEYEREACRLSFHIYKWYFRVHFPRSRGKSYSYQSFQVYNSKKAVAWLRGRWRTPGNKP